MRYLKRTLVALLLAPTFALASWTDGKIDLRPLDPDDPVGMLMMGAMVTVNIAGANDHTQAVQVCEGV
ncbi:hypothetical protein [Boseongicola sp. H5]|uniref:hypothetical protein n=1 Tax=Boseongicola sp. H5 TaxID=2763261 RepID=UPI001D09D6A9|nr:hypothetical protein [Boseongicola sp. H5]